MERGLELGESWPEAPYREVITREVICEVSGVDVKLQMGFNKTMQRSMCMMVLFLLVLDRRHGTTNLIITVTVDLEASLTLAPYHTC